MIKRWISRYLRWRDREREWQAGRARFARTFREDLYLTDIQHRNRRSHAPNR